MLTNKYYDSETRYVCDVCSEIVTNPICPECLTTEIRAWLTMYPDLTKALIPKLVSYLKRVDDHRHLEGTKCIKCNKSRAFVCPYCFTTYVLTELKRLEANKIVLKEFMEFFNYDFDHDYFSVEAERLGVI